MSVSLLLISVLSLPLVDPALINSMSAVGEVNPALWDELSALRVCPKRDCGPTEVRTQVHRFEERFGKFEELSGKDGLYATFDGSGRVLTFSASETLYGTSVQEFGVDYAAAPTTVDVFKITKVVRLVPDPKKGLSKVPGIERTLANRYVKEFAPDGMPRKFTTYDGNGALIRRYEYQEDATRRAIVLAVGKPWLRTKTPDDQLQPEQGAVFFKGESRVKAKFVNGNVVAATLTVENQEDGVAKFSYRVLGDLDSPKVIPLGLFPSERSFDVEINSSYVPVTSPTVYWQEQTVKQEERTVSRNRETPNLETSTRNVTRKIPVWFMIVNEQGEKLAEFVPNGATGKTYSYSYEYDKRGNWTKRTKSELVDRFGSWVYVPVESVTRSILYSSGKQR